MLPFEFHALETCVMRSPTELRAQSAESKTRDRSCAVKLASAYLQTCGLYTLAYIYHLYLQCTSPKFIPSIPGLSLDWQHAIVAQLQLGNPAPRWIHVINLARICYSQQDPGTRMSALCPNRLTLKCDMTFPMGSMVFR